MGDDHGSARLKHASRIVLAWIVALLGAFFVALYSMMAANALALGIAFVLVPIAVYILLNVNDKYRTASSKTAVYSPNAEGVVSTVDMNKIIVENATHDEAVSKHADRWLLGIGTIMLCFALFWYNDTKSLTDVAVKTTGTIVSQQRSSGSNSDTYTPIVMFRPYKHDAVRFEDSVGSSHHSWHIGDTVTVLYDPSNPKRAIIDHGFNYFGPLAMGVFGVASLIFSLWFYRRKNKFLKVSANIIFPSK